MSYFFLTIVRSEIEIQKYIYRKILRCEHNHFADYFQFTSRCRFPDGIYLEHKKQSV